MATSVPMLKDQADICGKSSDVHFCIDFLILDSLEELVRQTYDSKEHDEVVKGIHLFAFVIKDVGP